MTAPYDRLDAWIDAHFDEQVRFVQELCLLYTSPSPRDS